MPSWLVRQTGKQVFSDAHTKIVGAPRKKLLRDNDTVFSDAGNAAYCNILIDLIKAEMAKTNQSRSDEGSLYYHCDKLSLEHKADIIEVLLANLRSSKNAILQRLLVAIEDLCIEYCDLVLKDQNRAKPLFAVFGAWKRMTRSVPTDIHIPTDRKSNV